MPILVPRWMIPLSKQPAFPPHLARFLGFHEITGEEVEVADIFSLLSQLRRSEVIRLIVWLLSRVDTKEGITASVQMKLASRLLDEELFNRVRVFVSHLADEPWVIFHRQALWYLLQFAVVCCREQTEECNQVRLERTLGRCCLMASDCLEQADESFPPKEAPDEEIDEACVNILLSIREVGSEAVRPEILARAKQFWFEIPSENQIKQIAARHGIDPDFDQAFRTKFDLTLREFVMVVTICYGFFLGQETAKPRLLDVHEYFGKENASEVATKALSIVSQTPDGLARKLLNQPRQSWSRDFTPLRRHPMLRVSPEKLACPQLSFLCRVLADGIYWLLVDAYGDKANQFKTLFGSIFEFYTNLLLEQFAYGGSVLARTFYPKPRFAGPSDEVCDCILHWEKTAVVAEYKGGLLTPHQKYSGNRDYLFKGIDDLLMRHPDLESGKGSKKGIGQLADSLARIVKGEKINSGDAANPDGPDLSQCRLLPAIVTYDHSLGMHPIQRRAQRKLNELLAKSNVDNDRLGPVVLLTIDDVELLQDLQTCASVEQILLDYADFLVRNPRDRTGSFRAFAYNRFPKHRGDSRSFTRRNAAKLLEQASEELRRHKPRN